MNALRYLLFVVAFLLSIATCVSLAIAQEPPRQPNVTTTCGFAMVPATPGQTIGIAGKEVLVEVTLPTTGEWTHGPMGTGVSDPGLRLCHVPTDSYVAVSATDGREQGRVVTDPVVAPLLDQIVASATVTARPNARTETSGPDVAEGCGQRILTTALGETVRTASSHVHVEATLPATGSWGHTTVTLTAGTFGLLVCHLPSGSSVTISAIDGRESKRTLKDPAVAPLLDRVSSSARRVVDQPLRPPVSGDGGLLP